MAYSPISRAGLVESIEALYYARFGRFTNTYLNLILHGESPPKHIYAHIDRLKREKPWEKPWIPPRDKTRWRENALADAVPQPEMDAALENVLQLIRYAQENDGPIRNRSLWELCSWLRHVRKETLSEWEMEAAIANLRLLVMFAKQGGPEVGDALVRLGQWLVRLYVAKVSE